VVPEHRGKGLAAPGMAAVLRYALADVAPVASLDVNDFNTPARRTYEKVGLNEVGAFVSGLFSPRAGTLGSPAWTPSSAPWTSPPTSTRPWPSRPQPSGWAPTRWRSAGRSSCAT